MKNKKSILEKQLPTRIYRVLLREKSTSGKDISSILFPDSKAVMPRVYDTLYELWHKSPNLIKLTSYKFKKIKNYQINYAGLTKELNKWVFNNTLNLDEEKHLKEFLKRDQIENILANDTTISFIDTIRIILHIFGQLLCHNSYMHNINTMTKQTKSYAKKLLPKQEHEDAMNLIMDISKTLPEPLIKKFKEIESPLDWLDFIVIGSIEDLTAVMTGFFNKFKGRRR